MNTMQNVNGLHNEESWRDKLQSYKWKAHLVQ